MATLPEVLDCCALKWRTHDEIAREYDRKYPINFYSIVRFFRFLAQPDGPSVDLHSLLHTGVKQGKLELREKFYDPVPALDINRLGPYYEYRLKGMKEDEPLNPGKSRHKLYPCAA